MNRRRRAWLAGTLTITLLAGCRADDGGLRVATDVESRAAIAAFSRYWDEVVAISNAGQVPQNAFVTTTTERLRRDEIARATREAQDGVTRTGAPAWKDHRATVDGDEAVVVACINEDDWAFELPDGETRKPDDGWRMLGRELTKVNGEWLVSDYSPASSSDSC